MPWDVTSAALYFAPRSIPSVPRAWVEGALAFLARAGLPAQELALTTCDEDQAGSREFGKVVALAPYRYAMERELERNNVMVLGLYANPWRESDLVMDWYGLAYIDLDDGYCFLGLPRSVMPSPSVLLRLAHSLYAGIIGSLYGIGYFWDRLKGPDFYAIGYLANSFDFDPESVAAGDRISKWNHEKWEGRRYLRGWFRQAYPSNILSQAHVDAPLGGGMTLRTANIGRLTPLEPCRWLWELTEEEIPAADAALARAGLLICR